jgi:PAS domain-containing protein
LQNFNICLRHNECKSLDAVDAGRVRFSWLRDVTKKVEMPVQAARRSERFFTTLANEMPGLVAYWDCNLVCRFANKRYLEWFGKSPEQLIGNLTLKELLGEQVFVLNKPYVRAALAGVPQRFERTLTKADGTIG